MLRTAQTEPVVVCLGLEAGQVAEILGLLQHRGTVVVAPDTDATRRTLLSATGAMTEARPEPRPNTAPMHTGDLVVDPRRREALDRGEVLPLTARSFDLLCTLARSPGRVWTFEELSDRVWGQAYLGDPAAVISAVKRLRRALEPVDSVRIETVRGIGFRLDVVSIRSDAG